MRRNVIASLLLLCLALSQATCNKAKTTNQVNNKNVNPQATPNKPNVEAAPTPYQGAVKDLVKQQVGDYKLMETVSLKETEQEVPNAKDGLGATYQSTNGRTVQHLIINFPTTAEADEELHKAEQRYQKA